MSNNFSRASYAHTIASPDATLDQPFPARLRTHVHRLRLIVPVISVAVLALKRQDAELDDDIALVLHRHVIDPLDSEIEQLETLLESAVIACRRKEERVCE